VARIRSTIGVASRSDPSSTVSSMTICQPYCAAYLSRSWAAALVATTLTPLTIPTRSIFWPVSSTSSLIARTHRSVNSEVFGLVANTLRNPRSVIWSSNDMVIHGMPRRSATSVTARVAELMPVPSPATTPCESARFAAATADPTSAPASSMTSSIGAPPRDLMPPAALISSIAIWAPIVFMRPVSA
jgi:hypothetical protein